jgi:peptide deformylase
MIPIMPDEWIRQWGDPTLREVAQPVGGVDELLRRQVARMQQRLIEAPGAGLAATQVGLLRRLFGASLMQHEIDHLDGVLTLDRAHPAERRRAIALLLDGARGAATQAA